MKSEAAFHFTGRDSLSQFGVWLVILGAGCLPLPILVWQLGGLSWACAAVAVAVALVVLVGLRASIDVTSEGVVITKHWFFVPYYRYKADVIEDVWFGGDWGEPEGAVGVVVKLAGQEIHIGSRRSMHRLHEALFPLRAQHVAQQSIQADAASPRRLT